MRSRLSATDPVSRRHIHARLTEARTWLNVPADCAAAWSDRYYQAANRIAFLYWFREVLCERAWLVNIYFLDDPDYPTTKQVWDAALSRIERALGLGTVEVPGEGRSFLPAGRREELLRPRPPDRT
jgi:hypothetical protein